MDGKGGRVRSWRSDNSRHCGHSEENTRAAGPFQPCRILGGCLLDGIRSIFFAICGMGQCAKSASLRNLALESGNLLPATIVLNLMMSVNCRRCSDLQQIALTASKAYHELLEDLEAAHICHNSEVLTLLSTRLEAAFQSRNAAIAELSSHESTCMRKKSGAALPLSKGQSA